MRFHSYLIVREALTFLSNKTAEERHGDEKKEDYKEDRATDHTLRLWPKTNKQKGINY